MTALNFRKNMKNLAHLTAKGLIKAGDVIGEYSFDQPLAVGDRLVFEDMMHYTMVKTSFFNGVQHPAIGIFRENGQFDCVRQFSYEDFRNRLS